MATVNGLTAERTQEMFDETIVDASVVGEDLILDRAGGGTVTGPKIRNKAIQRVRAMGGYRAAQRRCPVAKAAVSVTLNAFDGQSGGSTVYNIDTLQNVAECNWKSVHVATFPTYLYKSIYTGPWNSGSSTPNGITKPMDFTTIIEGSYFSVGWHYLAGIWSSDVRVWIDDEEIENWYLGSRATGVLQNKTLINSSSLGTGSHVLNINFPARGVYKIRIAGLISTIGGGSSGNMVTINSQDTRLIKPAARPNVGIISDSFFEPIIGQTALSMALELGTQLNANIWNYAQGGSGFNNPSANGDNGDKSFGSILTWEAVARGPELDLLIIQGSDNDLSYSQAQNISAMQATFNKVRAYKPNLPVIWVGLQSQSYFKNLYTLGTIKARETALKAAALADPNVVAVLESANEEWLTGTGKNTAVANNGNQDFLTGADGVHLSTYGTIAYGRLISEQAKSGLMYV